MGWSWHIIKPSFILLLSQNNLTLGWDHSPCKYREFSFLKPTSEKKKNPTDEAFKIYTFIDIPKNTGMAFLIVKYYLNAFPKPCRNGTSEPLSGNHTRHHQCWSRPRGMQQFCTGVFLEATLEEELSGLGIYYKNTVIFLTRMK